MHKAKMSAPVTNPTERRPMSRSIEIESAYKTDESSGSQGSGCAHTTDVPDELCQRLCALSLKVILRHVQLSHRAYLHDTAGGTRNRPECHKSRSDAADLVFGHTNLL